MMSARRRQLGARACSLSRTSDLRDDTDLEPETAAAAEAPTATRASGGDASAMPTADAAARVQPSTAAIARCD